MFHRDQSLDHLFFVIYINDIPLFLSNTEEVIYADDVTLTTICDDVKRIESNLFIDTKNALEWCKANDMVLSLPKCCSMIVASRQRLQNIDSTIELKIDDTVIPWVTTTKILGVHFDNALSWDVGYILNMFITKLLKTFTYCNRLKVFSLLILESCSTTVIYYHT